MLDFAELGNNGPRYALSHTQQDEQCVGASSASGFDTGPWTTGSGTSLVEKFFIWSPGSVTCADGSGTNCSDDTTNFPAMVVAGTYIFYQAIRPWDEGATCFNLDGSAGAGDCLSMGQKIKMGAHLYGTGFGIGGIECALCQEQSDVRSPMERSVYSTSFNTYDAFSTTAQNSNGIADGEDYCNSSVTNNGQGAGTNGGALGTQTACQLGEQFTWSSSVNNQGGETSGNAFAHVAAWGRNVQPGPRQLIHNFTINEPYYAGVMLDGMQGGTTVGDMHLQPHGDAAQAAVLIGSQNGSNGLRVNGQINSNGGGCQGGVVWIAGTSTAHIPTDYSDMGTFQNTYGPGGGSANANNSTDVLTGMPRGNNNKCSGTGGDGGGSYIVFDGNNTPYHVNTVVNSYVEGDIYVTGSVIQ